MLPTKQSCSAVAHVCFKSAPVVLLDEEVEAHERYHARKEIWLDDADKDLHPYALERQNTQRLGRL